MSAERRSLWRDESGSALLEFTAGVLTFFTILFGIVEFSYAFYQWNAATKAVQQGARLAAVSEPAVSGFRDLSFVSTTVLPGDPIPSPGFDYLCEKGTTGCDDNALRLIVFGRCDPGETACSTVTINGSSLRVRSACNFKSSSANIGMCNIFARVNDIGKIRVRYKYEGLGYAGRPGGPVPTITVGLKDLQFEFILLAAFLPSKGIDMPNFLTMLQIFSRSVRKAKRILDIGFVTQDLEIGRQLKDFVSKREGVNLRVVASEKVVPGYDAGGLSVFVYDLDSSNDTSMREFERFMAQRPAHVPVIVLSPAVEDDLVRWLLRLRVADWIKTPLSPGELIAACGRVMTQPGGPKQEVKCLTFMGARGGVGTTSIAIHAALLAAKSQTTPNATCIVDLDLTAGACAEYLDLQPAWALDEIIADPARLDHHMLETSRAWR